ncbi:VWA domain-containing protein [Candidatus Woesearchaeota archaeon]|nr:VWA domain-containing protein [Candidatus Woesearchaeota archaeon]
MVDITFLNIQFLWVLFAIPIIIALHFFMMRYTKKRAVLFANFEAMKRVTGSYVLSKNITLLIARTLVILFMALSAAGMTLWTVGPGSEYNYVIAIDSSSSMLANDLEPNRLEVAKESSAAFVDSLNADVNIGVSSFSGIAKIETIPIRDKSSIKDAISNIEISSAGGTDISQAIITSVNSLLGQEDKQISIILLTDGQHTVGGPLEEGIGYAAEKRAVIHTIGIATEKGGSFELTELLSTIDEENLNRISENTGGKSYKVGDKTEMKAAFADLIELSEQNMPHQLRLPLLLIGLLLLFIEWILLNTRFKTLP